MTNSPMADDRIARNQAFFPFSKPLDVIEGDVVEATISTKPADSLIAWSARVVRTGQQARQSTWRSTILAERDHISADNKLARLSALGIARQGLMSLLDASQSQHEIEKRFVAEFSGQFPTLEEAARFARQELKQICE